MLLRSRLGAGCAWRTYDALSGTCRCIQRADQPIILTGYAALNKLLGREVYTSHMQLGGPKVGARSALPASAPQGLRGWRARPRSLR